MAKKRKLKPKIKLTEEQIRDVTDGLSGTCNDLDTIIASVTGEDIQCADDDVDDASLREIHAEIFQCEQCGWWHDMGDQAAEADTMMCSDCAEEDDE